MAIELPGSNQESLTSVPVKQRLGPFYIETIHFKPEGVAPPVNFAPDGISQLFKTSGPWIALDLNNPEAIISYSSVGIRVIDNWGRTISNPAFRIRRENHCRLINDLTIKDHALFNWRNEGDWPHVPFSLPLKVKVTRLPPQSPLPISSSQ